MFLLCYLKSLSTFKGKLIFFKTTYEEKIKKVPRNIWSKSELAHLCCTLNESSCIDDMSPSLSSVSFFCLLNIYTMIYCTVATILCISHLSNWEGWSSCLLYIVIPSLGQVSSQEAQLFECMFAGVHTYLYMQQMGNSRTKSTIEFYKLVVNC